MKEQLLKHAHSELKIKEVFIADWNETFYLREPTARLRYFLAATYTKGTAPLLAVALTLCDKDGNLSIAQVTPENVVIPDEDFEALGKIPIKQLEELVSVATDFFFSSKRIEEAKNS